MVRQRVKEAGADQGRPKCGEPSALAVGEEGVCLALADAPYVLSLDKP